MHVIAIYGWAEENPLLVQALADALGVIPYVYKLGLSTAETGDLVKSRKYLKHVLEEFPTSEEAKLAKNKLADIR